MTRPRILLVDDEVGILEVLASTIELEALDVDVVLEPSSRAATTRLAMDRYDLVMSDFRMPGVDGIDVLRASRRRNPNGRRVLLTGYNEVPAEAERIADAKMDLILHKPIGPDEFVAVVRSLLGLTPAQPV